MTLFTHSKHSSKHFCDECSPPSEREKDVEAGLTKAPAESNRRSDLHCDRCDHVVSYVWFLRVRGLTEEQLCAECWNKAFPDNPVVDTGPAVFHGPGMSNADILRKAADIWCDYGYPRNLDTNSDPLVMIERSCRKLADDLEKPMKGNNLDNNGDLIDPDEEKHHRSAAQIEKDKADELMDAYPCVRRVTWTQSGPRFWIQGATVQDRIDFPDAARAAFGNAWGLIIDEHKDSKTVQTTMGPLPKAQTQKQVDAGILRHAAEIMRAINNGNETPHSHEAQMLADKLDTPSPPAEDVDNHIVRLREAASRLHTASGTAANRGAVQVAYQEAYAQVTEAIRTIEAAQKPRPPKMFQSAWTNADPRNLVIPAFFVRPVVRRGVRGDDPGVMEDIDSERIHISLPRTGTELLITHGDPWPADLYWTRLLFEDPDT